MNLHSLLDAITNSKAASAPIIGVAGMSLFGLSLPEWASVVTICYTLLLAYLRIRREWEKRQQKRWMMELETEPGDL